MFKTLALTGLCLGFLPSMTGATTLPLKDRDLELDVNWQTSPAPTPINKLDLYQCPQKRTLKLQKAIKDMSVAAGALRDAMDDTQNNKPTVAMLDYVFNGAFSTDPAKNENVLFVRNAFDLMSKSLTVNIADSKEEAANRVVCVQSDQYQSLFNLPKDHPPPRGAGSQRHAVVFFTDLYFSEKTINKKYFVCKSKRLTGALGRAADTAHEFSHLAGVDLPYGVQETYTFENAVGLPPDLATRNAQNFGFAVLFHLSGCTTEWWPPEDQQYDDGSSDELKRKKLLQVADGWPEGDKTNTTDVKSEVEPDLLPKGSMYLGQDIPEAALDSFPGKNKTLSDDVAEGDNA